MFKTIVKSHLLIVACFIMFSANSQTNLTDSSVWVEGVEGNQTAAFVRYGANSVNIVEQGIGPYDESVLVWKATANPASGGAANQDGGWNGAFKTIDPNNTYRFSVWVKKTGSDDGRLLLGMLVRDDGTVASALSLNNNTAIANPYFANGDLPTLDEWYYVVGFMHNSGHTATIVESAVYDTQGVPVIGGPKMNDFKFTPGATRIRDRAFLQLSSTADDMFFYAPALYVVNGQEPSIQDLIAPDNPVTEGVWSLNGTNAFFSGGKVGINTSVPDYELTVKGKIHAEEVKIDLTVPAPDYVFKEDYDLQSLEAIEQYIDEYGHLPNIPSATEMETNGVELGLMEMKLLEKIEELTLHLIDLKKENKVFKAQLEELQKEK